MNTKPSETEKVFNRKRELIKRDPQYKEACNLFSKEIGRARHTPENIIDLVSILEKKWLVLLRLNHQSKEIELMLPYNTPAVIWVGSPPFRIGHDWITEKDPNKYPLLAWAPYPNLLGEDPILADAADFVKALEGKWLPLMVDVSRLNKADAKRIKKHLWAVIENNLPQKAGTRAPVGEDAACSFLYHIRSEETFKNYLRWYDIYMEEKLSFRLIAHYEKTPANKRDELLEKLRTKRIKWGIHVKGEDKVEKGIKLIYRAIHRKDYSQKDVEAEIDEYKCPKHDNKSPLTECPLTCAYRKQWEGRFNRLNPK